MILTYDSVDLTVDPYLIRKYPHDLWPDRRFETQPISRESGVLVLDSQFSDKKFTMEGKITGTSMNNLESNIDVLKELFSRTLKNLDIGYSSGTRRYLAYVDNLKIDRDFYHLMFVPFTCDFIIPSGIGINPNATTSTVNSITNASYSGSLSMTGSKPAKPIITVTINSATAITGFSLTVNGDKITITQALSAGNVLVIDCSQKKVTYNGTEILYSGIFPRFIVGTNSYVAAAPGTSRNYNISIVFNPTYL